VTRANGRTSGRPDRRNCRLLAAFATAVVTSLPLAVGGALPARADSAADADARANKLLAQVAAIQKQVDGALANYDGALSGLAGVVSSNIEADTALDNATQEDAAAKQQAAARVAALYRAGGTFGLYATVLDGSDPSDVLTRMQVVRRVVSTDQRVVDVGRQKLQHARVTAVNARSAANGRAQAAAKVDAVAKKLEGLLAQEQALLAQAKADTARMHAAEAALTAAQSSYGAITAERIQTIQPLAMSPEYAGLYRAAAATCPGLSWTVLAAIGQVETGHGRNTNTSSAGAEGPMQFLPSTFASYGVDGNHDGAIDILNPADAIFSAANYLCANGAGLGGEHLANAIWHYNHAGWYVQLVLTLSGRYTA
jgi:membrane-bound lytic murein transglycosylase B